MFQISDSELIIMKFIWKQNGRAMYSEIVQGLEEMDLQWKKNTILTFLSRLVDKKILKVEKVGRRNDYIALLTEEEYRSQQTRNFVGKIYDGNVKGLISALVEQEAISSSDLEELRSYWDKKGKKHE